MRRNNKALYEKIMRNISKQVKKALNESANNDIDILEFVDPITFNSFVENSRFVSGLSGSTEEDKETAKNIVNDAIKALFKTKLNFIDFVKDCAECNWGYICNTDYERLDDEGWNIWIYDAIEDTLKEWQSKIDYEALERGEYDTAEGDEEPLFDKYGLVYFMIENNDLNLDFGKHPDEDYYEENGFGNDWLD